MREYDVTLSASYMEIYRDEVYDLFVDREAVGLVFCIFGVVPSTRELTYHYPFSSDRPLNYQSERMMQAKFLSQTYLHYQ
jgi:hypothetical protein